jgi:hypothetical protein
MKGMKSPNPTGRPKRIIDRRAKLREQLLTNADRIVDKMVAQALEGDAQAANIVLSRIMPALRAQSERVEFEFVAGASVVLQVEAVLQAISEGKVAPDAGKEIIEAIGALASIKAVAELEARLEKLEARQSQ